jgi:ubiquinone/menaquinone biosynthesis C-methylase UbiE
VARFLSKEVTVDRNGDLYYRRYQQYRDTSKMRNRIQLHEKYRTYQYPWLLWVFDQLDLQPGMDILEFGCGPGALWMQNNDRMPENVSITLSDLNTGMIKSALENFSEDDRFQFLIADVQDAPLLSDQYDVVLANQLLSHVNDLRRSIHTIHRLLKPGGVLFATINGLRHMYNIYELVQQVVPSIQFDTAASERFGLHNAAQKLSPEFRHVYVTVYPDFLWVTETEPLLAYIRSLWSEAEIDQEQLKHIRDIIEHRIAVEGGIHINKSTGIVKARRV